MTLDGRDVSADGTKLDTIATNADVTGSNTCDTPGGAGTDTTAVHDNVANEITAVTLKAAPVAADEIILEDSAASYVKKSATLNTLGSAIPYLKDADGDTKIDLEESGDEDIVRMDVGGTEAFHLSAIGELTLAKQAVSRAYRTTLDQVLPASEWVRIGLNAEDFDVQNEFNTTTKSGTADATEANKLHDADGNFASSDIGAWIWNKTDNSYTQVTGFVDSGELDLADDIMADTETYELYHSIYTATEAGYYVVIGNLGFRTFEADKRFYIGIYKNGSGEAFVSYHSALAVAIYGLVSAVIYLAASDTLELRGWQGCTTVEPAYNDRSITYMSIAKIA